MTWRWYEYIARVGRSPSKGVAQTPEYLFPGPETPSAAADQLVEEFRALDKQMRETYGEVLGELPYNEWVIWRGLMARVSDLSAPEQRYLWRRIGGEHSNE